jgi:hypothetical protein
MADALDPDSRRITPGFLRNSLTTWHQGDAAVGMYKYESKKPIA